MFELIASIPIATYLAFWAAGIVLNLAPGADVIFTTASGLRGGPRAGGLAGLGVGLGSLVHIALAAAGVSALLAAYPAAFTVLRWAGAAYLAWLAVKAWRAEGGLAEGQGAQTPLSAMRRGFLTNVLNPKVALFVLAFLPQFADPALGPVWQQILLFGAIFSVTGTIITCGYGILAGALGRRITTKGRLLNRISSVMFGGLAVRLVLD
ncbi:LysE family translocator [Actibacterium lipolyticum]|uniref:Homoserine/homoserine lactone efflux protein n=1 Tax=Actibacterium lipolyticum TaxID=1524263 RepID=A0A238KU09_9RHOB|nr:LysE family translocator [Actibacterium lipolyticum]SMX46289.1 Homoserine/homoserine lactone efflux protein [Actibacterium lipolyticum]